MKREDRRPEFFPFFPGQFLASENVDSMTPTARGAYITLLCKQWLDPTCSLPHDERKLARMSGLCDEWDAHRDALMACFSPHPSLEGRIANGRMLRDYNEAIAQMKRVSEQRTLARAARQRAEHEPSTARQRRVVTRARRTERNRTERNGTEEEEERARKPPAAAAETHPEVEAIAAAIEASLPPGDKRRGSAKRRSDLAAICAALGTARVRAAVDGCLSWASSVPELDSIRNKLAWFEDSLAGDHGRNRVEQIERALPKRRDDGLRHYTGPTTEEAAFEAMMLDWGWRPGEQLPPWAVNWKPGDPIPPRRSEPDEPDDEEAM